MMGLTRSPYGIRSGILPSGREAVHLIQRAGAKTLAFRVIGGFVRSGDAKVLETSLTSPPVGPTDDRVIEQTPPLDEHPFTQLPCLGIENVVAIDSERRQGFVGRQDGEQEIQCQFLLAHRGGEGMLEQARTDGRPREASVQEGAVWVQQLLGGGKHVGTHGIPIDGGVKDEAFARLALLGILSAELKAMEKLRQSLSIAFQTESSSDQLNDARKWLRRDGDRLGHRKCGDGVGTSNIVGDGLVEVCRCRLARLDLARSVGEEREGLDIDL